MRNRLACRKTGDGVGKIKSKFREFVWWSEEKRSKQNERQKERIRISISTSGEIADESAAATFA